MGGVLSRGFGFLFFKTFIFEIILYYYSLNNIYYSGYYKNLGNKGSNSNCKKS